MLNTVGSVWQLARRVLPNLHGLNFGFAIVVGLFTIAACTQEAATPPADLAPIATPTPFPTAEPTPILSTPTAVPPSQTPVNTPTAEPTSSFPDLSIVSDAFGYAIALTHPPEDFDFAGAKVAGELARLTYVSGDKRLVVAYNLPFSAEDSPFMREIGLVRPTDALVTTTVNGQDANIMLGGWSDETIMQGPSVDPATAKWDYDKTLTVFFDYAISNNKSVGVAVQALVRPSEWTTMDQMITIAESVAQAN